MKKVYLLCNAHIDPVWQWGIGEGKAAAVSTFRSAATLLEKYDFIFCHNESVLYEWVEEYEPKLFERICKLVKEGKWRIMGGWFIQPDCNMPSAESIIREIEEGNNFFKNKIGVEGFKTGVNFDSFGHSAGLPLLLNEAGYTNYICTRPMDWYKFYGEQFVWNGIGGGKLRVLHPCSYNSELGVAINKIKAEADRTEDGKSVVVLWGVGNHGGGPSRKDLEDIEKYAEENPDIEIIHTDADSLKELKFADNIPEYEGDLFPCFTGSFTSLSNIKYLFRKLENIYYPLEKLAAYSSARGLAEYPEKQLKEIEKTLLFCEFHDILSGTMVRHVYDEIVRKMGGAISKAEELTASLVYKNAVGDKVADEGEYPLIVFNPFPYKIKFYIEASILMLVRFMSGFADFIVFKKGKQIKSQTIKEDSNIPIEWAKKIVFEAELEPLCINRFDAKIVHREEKPIFPSISEDYTFDNGRMKVHFSKFGFIDLYVVDGAEILNTKSFVLAIYSDNEDPWAMQQYQHKRIGNLLESFRLATQEESDEICALPCNKTKPLRIIEDGDVYRVIEGIYVCGKNYAVIKYKLYKSETYFDIVVETHFAQSNRMLKYLIPNKGKVTTQIIGGREEISSDGADHCCHKWIATTGKGAALSIINDSVYGFSVFNGMIELSLLRGTAYTAHFISEDRKILREDRFNERAEQGERRFFFRVNGNIGEEIADGIDREAYCMNEIPYEVNMFPNGNGNKEDFDLRLDGSKNVILTAFFKKNESEYALRLENMADIESAIKLTVGNVENDIIMKPFETSAYVYDGKTTIKQNNIVINKGEIKYD